MEPKKSIGVLMKQINTIYEKEFNQKLKALGVTASQCTVLTYLFNSRKESINQRDIERHLNLKNPTVTGLLKRLDEKGFVFTIPSSSDKRCKNVYLTEKAYDIQKKLEQNRRQLDKRCTLGLSSKEVDSLKRMLDKVLYNIEEP